jgi:hypothetical protein
MFISGMRSLGNLIDLYIITGIIEYPYRLKFIEEAIVALDLIGYFSGSR